MPREIVHWEILQSSLEKSHFGKSLMSTDWDFLALAAMLPDVFYYHKYGASEFESIAEQLHGSNGEDTYEVLRNICMAETSLSLSSRQALIIGYLSHCIIDATFHPVIYSLSGDYYANDLYERTKSQTRHRALETYLDQFWLKQYKIAGGYSIKTALRKLASRRAIELNELFNVLSQATGKAGSQDWYKACQQMAFVTSLANSSLAGIVLSIVNKILAKRFDAQLALLAYNRRVAPAWFNGRFRYKEPTSARVKEVSWTSLRDCCVNDLVNWIEVVSCARFSDTNPFKDMIGPSLNTGLIATTQSDLRHFSIREIE